MKESAAMPAPANPRDDAGLIQSVAFSHIGLVRTTNEDRILDDPERGIFAIADGMGGHTLGDWAATQVIQALLGIEGTGPSPEAIRHALGEANGVIQARAKERGVTCGSTVAGLTIGQEGLVHIFWAGDSRVYRLRDGSLERLSKDHSVIQELIDSGALTETEARGHPRGNVITRALGVWSQVDIECVTLDSAAGDLYLVCSDGVSGALRDEEIGRHLQRPLANAVQDMIGAALRMGGKDNISAVLISI